MGGRMGDVIENEMGTDKLCSDLPGIICNVLYE
jgi:hypothetical protein